MVVIAENAASWTACRSDDNPSSRLANDRASSGAIPRMVALYRVSNSFVKRKLSLTT